MSVLTYEWKIGGVTKSIRSWRWEIWGDGGVKTFAGYESTEAKARARAEMVIAALTAPLVTP